MSDGVMADPAPENIDGSKNVSHIFEHQMQHRVNWSHVALAVVALIVAYVLFVRGGGEVEPDEESNAPAAGGGGLG
jgi:hypothetical protein